VACDSAQQELNDSHRPAFTANMSGRGPTIAATRYQTLCPKKCSYTSTSQEDKGKVWVELEIKEEL